MFQFVFRPAFRSTHSVRPANSPICPPMMCSDKPFLKIVVLKTIFITPRTAAKAAQDWIGQRKFAKQPWELQVRKKILKKFSNFTPRCGVAGFMFFVLDDNHPFHAHVSPWRAAIWMNEMKATLTTMMFTKYRVEKMTLLRYRWSQIWTFWYTHERKIGHQHNKKKLRPRGGTKTSVAGVGW